MKKTIKPVATKKTVKTKKNVPVVDITMCEDATDVYAAFGKTKVEKGLPISDVELDAIVTNFVDATVASMFTWNNTVMLDKTGKYVKMNLTEYVAENVPEQPKKKPGIFKRFWNWLIRKK